MTFAEALEKAMQQAGMNAAQLSAASGITQNYISKIRTGWLKDPTIGKAMPIIKALGLSYGEFLTLLDEDETFENSSQVSPASPNSTNTQLSFFEVMDKVMKEKGFNYNELAQKSGVYPSYLSNLKSGITEAPRWDKGCAIIEALGLTLDEFKAIMEGTEEENQPRLRASFGSIGPTKNDVTRVRYWADLNDGKGYRRVTKSIRGSKKDAEAFLRSVQEGRESNKASKPEPATPEDALTFAEAMRTAMESKGFSNRELASKSDIGEPYISQLLNERIKDPAFSKAIAIIHALDIDVVEFSAVLGLSI